MQALFVSLLASRPPRSRPAKGACTLRHAARHRASAPDQSAQHLQVGIQWRIFHEHGYAIVWPQTSPPWQPFIFSAIVCNRDGHLDRRLLIGSPLVDISCRRQVTSSRTCLLAYGLKRDHGSQFAKLRKARDMSQEELAQRAEIDRTYISALERSVHAAGIDVVDRLARSLGVEAAAFNTPARSLRQAKNSWEN